ncbi:MAG TPA: response regulator transcription factor [Hanamia sp.]|jgi:two-component system, OmpR family, alkaline phosphatase synthesis response regulator PhoP|nr:response regulator transcription factor [Hanamia sp.]
MMQETKTRTILIADDEPDILEILNFNLQAEGYQVMSASNGNQAVSLAKLYKPDLIILDVMMPGKTGFQVCKILRSDKEFDNTIIIFLTALNDESTEIKGLETGGDDYISKPISPKVLISRVNALFRRIIKETGSILQIGDLVIDRERYVVSLKNEEIVLARKEFELLELLASKPAKVFLRNEILDKVWGTEVIVGDRTIDVHVRKIRQKLGDECIATVKGVGYKFKM